MVKILLKDSYLAVIKNALGSNMFRNFYAEVDGVKKDILEDGNLSCAIFVSNVAHMFGLIKGPHTTVKSTIVDLEQSGWYEIEKIEIGAVLHWESVDFGKTGMHEHIGFYMGEGIAISNSATKGYPVEHSYDYEGKRKIEKIFFHKSLE